MLILKNILILGKGPTQVLGDTTVTEEAEYSINFAGQGRNFVLVFITMEATVIYLLME